MKKKTYDVFVSYRRTGAFETAGLIAEKLRSADYNVFLDVESLRSGKFNEQLYAVIGQCTDFILVLPKDGLEHCAEPSDWVRKEVLHAMQHGKNIIPVLLKDFTWPAKMPSGMEGLENYQGIAAGSYEYFDAAMEKLKSYLKSEPDRPARRKLGYGSGILLGVVLVAALIWLGLRSMAVPVCTEQVNKITSKMAVIDLLASQLKELGNDWNRYYEQYRTVAPADTAFLNGQMRETLAFRRNEIKKLQHDTVAFGLTSFQHFMLYMHGIDASEIEVFHRTFYPSYFDDAAHSLEVLETFLRMETVPEISLVSNEVNTKAFGHATNLLYYCYLELLSTMPAKALKNYKELSTYWENYPTHTMLNLPKEEYERLEKIELEKIEVLNQQIAVRTTGQAVDLEREERKLRELKKKAEEQKASPPADSQQAAKTAQHIEHIEQLAAEVTGKQQQLQATERKIEDSLRRIMEKCRLTPGDDQYQMWGKIVRLATIMNRTAVRRAASEKQNEHDKAEARAKGYDVSGWFEVTYSLTTGEMLRQLHDELDRYRNYFPETGSYVPAVKQFYAEVEKGTFPLGGMVVMGTKDNLPHPILQTGDILIARKGIAVNNVTDYKSAKEQPREDTFTFLRRDAAGKLNKLQQSVPGNNVLVGFLELKESE